MPSAEVLKLFFLNTYSDATSLCIMGGVKFARVIALIMVRWEIYLSLVLSIASTFYLINDIINLYG